MKNKIVSFLNCKGGVGKTTLTVALADFSCSTPIDTKIPKILVMDFDPQGSASKAILGKDVYDNSVRSNSTLSNTLFANIFLPDYDNSILSSIRIRKAKKGGNNKQRTLGELDVMFCELDSVLEFNSKNHNIYNIMQLATSIKSIIVDKYDYIFIDLPAGVNKLSYFSLIGSFLTDGFVIPVESTRISVSSLENTMKLYEYVNKYKDIPIIGFIINQTDKSTKPYKKNYPDIKSYAKKYNTVVFKRHLTNNTNIANAVDDTKRDIYIRNKYDPTNTYTSLRRVTNEILNNLNKLNV